MKQVPRPACVFLHGISWGSLTGWTTDGRFPIDAETSPFPHHVQTGSGFSPASSNECLGLLGVERPEREVTEPHY
jgi:hypothetical protein